MWYVNIFQNNEVFVASFVDSNSFIPKKNHCRTAKSNNNNKKNAKTIMSNSMNLNESFFNSILEILRRLCEFLKFFL